MRDTGQAWELAKRCLDLPPELQQVDLPTLLDAQRKTERTIPLAGDWEPTPEAHLTVERKTAKFELPSYCYDGRTIEVKGDSVTFGVSQGC